MIHTLFGKKIRVKTYDCLGRVVDPRVNIFVNVTNACNCHCEFCCNKCDNRITFSYDKLLDIIYELERSNISVNKINITGGEPSIVPDRVTRLLEILPKDIHFHLNTNGILDESRELMKDPRWDSISMSIHHYDKDKIKEIYKIKDLPSKYLNFSDIDTSKLNFSCNLISKYIDSPKEMEKMMIMTKDLGIKRIGFVSLMEYNYYCYLNFVDWKYIDFYEIPNLKYKGCMERPNACRCRNYIYDGDLEVYMRYTLDSSYNESVLVYDGYNLTNGFNYKEVII